MIFSKFFTFRIFILGTLIVALSLCQNALAKMPTVIIANNKIKVEVAQTREQIEHGLMERASMPEDHGMVFLFRPARPVRFWMYNCVMSLDMIFVKDGKIVKIAAEVPRDSGRPRYRCRGN